MGTLWAHTGTIGCIVIYISWIVVCINFDGLVYVYHTYCPFHTNEAKPLDHTGARQQPQARL